MPMILRFYRFGLTLLTWPILVVCCPTTKAVPHSGGYPESDYTERPELHIHGFGAKLTVLGNQAARDLLRHC
jgi:hypothetical protein